MKRNWTREEAIIALYVYAQIPLRECSKKHPLVVEYAKILGRTPDSLNMKIANFARLDPCLKAQKISGLRNGAKIDEEVWRESRADPDKFEAECKRLVAEYTAQSVAACENGGSIPRERDISFFRRAVLCAYDHKCCISGVCGGNDDALLDVARIEESVPNRNADPCNGLCLNVFFRRAYDAMLVAVDFNMKIAVSPNLIHMVRETEFQDYLAGLNGREISRPERFSPDESLLAKHFSRFSALALG